MYVFNHCLKLNRAVQIFQTRRFYAKTARYVERLNKRTILRLSGPDTSNYIQNMITNDVKKIENCPTLYSLFLNANGRVVYDLILYKILANNYLVEYDTTGVKHLQKHLVMYRLRKNVKIEPLSNMSVWVIYKQYEDEADLDNSLLENIADHLKKIDGVVTFSEDPRSSYLGIRVVTNSDVNLQASLAESGILENDKYRLLRYKLGIGEGVLDHPPGNCLPFETNVDLLNGVSFTKGCYIGQEMTARSNFVLSIRKRLMPVIFDQLDTYPIFPPECNVINEKKQKVGRLRSHLGQNGLALLKYEDALKSNYLQLQGFDIHLKAVRPKWWPENLSSDKNEHIYSV